jgi:HK97 family phage major capsid protein
MAACQYCGTWFEDKSGSGRPRLYCSDAHRQAAYRDRKGEPMTYSDPEVARVLAEARAIPGGHYPAGRSWDRELDPQLAELDNQVARYGAGATGKALQSWLATGDRSWIESKALVEDSGGQILLPPDLTIDVLEVARDQGMLRSMVTVRPTQLARVPVGTLSTASTGWGQLETGTATTDAAVVPAASGGGTIVVQDLTALVKIGADELADTPAATNQMLAEVLGDAIAEAEDLAIAAGTGSSQPAGLTLAANITRIPAGQKTTAASPPTIANLRALPWLLPARYRPRATWLMSTDAAAAVALLTDAAGGPIWPNPGNPDPANDGGFMGWPAYTVPGLPAMTGTNAPSILFGDLKSAYRLVDRQRITLQRLEQRFVELGQVGILMRYRIGGDVLRPNALTAYLL